MLFLWGSPMRGVIMAHNIWSDEPRSSALGCAPEGRKVNIAVLCIADYSATTKSLGLSRPDILYEGMISMD